MPSLHAAYWAKVLAGCACSRRRTVVVSSSHGHCHHHQQQQWLLMAATATAGVLHEQLMSEGPSSNCRRPSISAAVKAAAAHPYSELGSVFRVCTMHHEHGCTPPAPGPCHNTTAVKTPQPLGSAPKQRRQPAGSWH
jgi:hypothetical protein